MRLTVVAFPFLAGAALFAAETARPATSAERLPPGRTGASARGPLPDPALLDGSKVAAEKKGDFGMIGDFELPGEEDGKKDKAGGAGSGWPENQQGESGGSGQPGAGGQAGQPGVAGTGKQGPQGQGAGPEGKEVQGGAAGAGDPNAKPEGMKVAQLGGDATGAVGAEGPQKPPQVAIGDAAMRIPQNQQAMSGVVGAQQAANQNTQVYEKGTGTGGKGPTGKQGPNRTEKGRSIPAGL
ncbi:MAG: hypothetical protein ACKODK_21895 [Opitutaceae bacterium]